MRTTSNAIRYFPDLINDNSKPINPTRKLINVEFNYISRTP